MEWQPIETAPKDGTRILIGVWDLGPDVTSARWNGAFWDMSIQDEEFCGESDFAGPTHWMPLPDPPK